MDVAFVTVAVVLIVGALVILKRRWPNRNSLAYGGTFAFVFHVTAVFCLGLLVMLMLSPAPLNAIVAVGIALCLADVTIGVLSRRRLRRRLSQ
jgi:hypothetical protein